MSSISERDTRWPPRWHVRAYIRGLRASGMWTNTDGGRFRWWLWRLANHHRDACPANTHSLLIWGYLRDPRIDRACRMDCARTGICWCGKLRQEEAT